ncbi:MAG: alanine dehydrogenase [Tissierellia bacterium]|nr:alanine dehydrogenase [Tissierellia bacterium]
MKIGVPVEVKNKEHRVALTPSGVSVLVEAGHEVYFEKDCGLSSGIANEEYEQVGAKQVESAKEVWACDMVLKVKEPLEEEFKYFREGLILFTYLHLANEPELAKELVKKKVTAIAYETVRENGKLPLLTPMSQVAGRMAPIIAAQYLQQQNGGEGILLGAVPGVKRGLVTIIGDGNVGVNAAKMAIGLGANVNLIGIDPEKMKELDNLFGTDAQTLMSNRKNIEDAVKESDVVIGAVLLPGGARAPKLVTEDMVKKMRPGSVVIDVAIDQGGIFETIDRVTTHDDPTFVKHGIVHYAVANIPGAVPRTSTFALTNATINYVKLLADKPLEDLIRDNEALAAGVNTYKGYLTLKSIAKEQGLDYKDVRELI